MYFRIFRPRVIRIGICLLALLLPSNSAHAFENGIHKTMSASDALPFIRPTVMDDINDEHSFQELAGALDADEHFDNCHFSGGAAERGRGESLPG